MTTTTSQLNLADLAAAGITLLNRKALPVSDIPATVAKMVPDATDGLTHMIAAAMYRRIENKLTVVSGDHRDNGLAALHQLSQVMDDNH